MPKVLIFFALLLFPVVMVRSAFTDEPTQKQFQEPKTYAEARQLSSQTPGFKNLQKLGLALHNYHDLFGQFPPAVVYAADGKTTHSWRVELLPLLGHYLDGVEPARLKYMDRALYNQAIKDCGYDINQKWDSPENRELLNRMPSVYRHPDDQPDSTQSAFYAVTGTGTAFDPDKVSSYTDIREWPASTLMLVESRSRVPWTKPVDILYSKEAAVPRLGGFTQHGFLVLSADGGVHFISESVSPQDLRAFISMDSTDTFNILGIPFRYER